MSPHDADEHTDRAEADLRTRYNQPPHGVLDRFIRRFGTLSHVLAILFLYAIASTALGVALLPALWLHSWAAQWSAEFAPLVRDFIWGGALGAGFFVAGLSLMLVVPIYNFLLPTRVRPFVGGYFAWVSVPWCLHNGLFYLVRYTFLPFATLTPLGTWFLRAMGMHVGRRAYINTEFISDPRLIHVGDDAVIGGSVHLFAHFGGAGHLTVAPVVIGARATIGQGATIMGDVQVGEGATILPHSVLLPGARVEAGAMWGGVPARPISRADMDAYKHLTHEGQRRDAKPLA